MRAILPILLLSAATPAAAEVVSADAHGFEVASSVSLAVPVPRAYAAFSRIGACKATNMSLALQPGGCFCEAIPGGGGVEHMRVAMVQPGKRIVLTGGLGPLLYEGTSSVMDVKFEAAAGGSKVTMSYRAAGFARGNGDKMAPLVDAVLAEQMKGFAAYAGK